MKLKSNPLFEKPRRPNLHRFDFNSPYSFLIHSKSIKNARTCILESPGLEQSEFQKQKFQFLKKNPAISNKRLWESIFGRGRTMRMMLWTSLIAAKQLSSYLTREDKSLILLVCWTTQLMQYVPIHDNNPVISWQCLKICTSSMPTCSEPDCNIGHKWLQPWE